ncbi:NADP-dependent oxidoreductase, partial [Klenkia terrae]
VPVAVFGTAQFADVPRDAPQHLLQVAWDAGFRRFDTAPLYAFGQAEEVLGRFLAGRDDVQGVTTKVGLAPQPDRPLRRRVVGVAKAALPAPLLARAKGVLRPAPGQSAPREMASGRFGVTEVRSSVETSLRRLGGRVDRLLLHEVRPHDVTTELLDLLAGVVERGDVGSVGVATQNHDTLGALAAGGELFTAANTAVGPLHTPVALPDHVVARTGHGLLGGGGEHLRRLQAVLADDPTRAQRWQEVTRDTEFAGPRGLGHALLARGAELDVTEVIVGSTTERNVAPAFAFAHRDDVLPEPVSAALADLVQVVRALPSTD